jgi:succinate dehydrogenase / fumarate reductase membrane anchor subunit
VDRVSRQTHALRAWLIQRFSAVYLAGFLVYLVIHFMTSEAAGYAEWCAWLAQPAMVLSGAGFFIALVLHGWVGVRDIILDYISALGLRLLLLALSGALLLASGLWAVRLLLVNAA